MNSWTYNCPSDYFNKLWYKIILEEKSDNNEVPACLQC